MNQQQLVYFLTRSDDVKYKCGNCNEIVELQKLRRKVLKGLAYEFYHHCPNCDLPNEKTNTLEILTY